MKRTSLFERQNRIALHNCISLAQLDLEFNTELYDDYMLRMNPLRFVNETDEEYSKRSQIPDKITVEKYLQTIIKLKAEVRLRELELEKHDQLNN